MKKKAIIGILLALAVAAQGMVAFGAGGSTDSDDNEPSYSTGSGSAGSTVTVNADGVKVTGTVTSTTAGGSTIAISVDGKTASGMDIQVNGNGEAVVGDKVLTFAKGDAATAGLPGDVVDSIGRLNSGEALSSIIVGYDITQEGYRIGGSGLDLANAPLLDLTGYYALTGTHALVTKNVSTGAVDDTPTEAVIYVPNLVDGLENVAVLYYNNATGNWVLLPITKIDTASKLVYVTVTGSGTLSVVYKR